MFRNRRRDCGVNKDAKPWLKSAINADRVQIYCHQLQSMLVLSLKILHIHAYKWLYIYKVTLQLQEKLYECKIKKAKLIIVVSRSFDMK